MVRRLQASMLDGKTRHYGPLRCGDGSRHRQRRFPVLQGRSLGTDDREHRNCLDLHRFLFAIHKDAMTLILSIWLSLERGREKT